MSRQLQYPHDAHDAEDLDDTANVLELFGAVARAVEAERQIERQDGKDVDEIQRTLQPPQFEPTRLLFGSKLGFSRILDSLYGAFFGGVHALGYNSAESEPIWIKSGAL